MKKISNTNDCKKCAVVRRPTTGERFLCAALGNGELVLMRWNVMRYTEVHRVASGFNLPEPLVNFDLITHKNMEFPLVSFGVFQTEKQKIHDEFQLHLVDLNTINESVLFELFFYYF